MFKNESSIKKSKIVWTVNHCFIKREKMVVRIFKIHEQTQIIMTADTYKNKPGFGKNHKVSNILVCIIVSCLKF